MILSQHLLEMFRGTHEPGPSISGELEKPVPGSLPLNLLPENMGGCLKLRGSPSLAPKKEH